MTFYWEILVNHYLVQISGLTQISKVPCLFPFSHLLQLIYFFLFSLPTKIVVHYLPLQGLGHYLLEWLTFNTP